MNEYYEGLINFYGFASNCDLEIKEIQLDFKNLSYIITYRFKDKIDFINLYIPGVMFGDMEQVNKQGKYVKTKIVEKLIQEEKTNKEGDA